MDETQILISNMIRRGPEITRRRRSARDLRRGRVRELHAAMFEPWMQKKEIALEIARRLGVARRTVEIDMRELKL